MRKFDVSYVKSLSVSDKLELLSLNKILSSDKIENQKVKDLTLLSALIEDDRSAIILANYVGLSCSGKQDFFDGLKNDDYYNVVSQKARAWLDKNVEVVKNSINALSLEDDFGFNLNPEDSYSSVVNPFRGINDAEYNPRANFTIEKEEKADEFNNVEMQRIKNGFRIKNLNDFSNQRMNSSGELVQKAESFKTKYPRLARVKNYLHSKFHKVRDRRAYKTVFFNKFRNNRKHFKLLEKYLGKDMISSFASSVEREQNYTINSPVETIADLIYNNTLALLNENKKILLSGIRYVSSELDEKSLSKEEINIIKTLSAILATKYILQLVNVENYATAGTNNAIEARLNNLISNICYQKGYNKEFFIIAHQTAKRLVKEYVENNEQHLSEISNTFTNRSPLASETEPINFNDAMFRMAYDPYEEKINNLYQTFESLPIEEDLESAIIPESSPEIMPRTAEREDSVVPDARIAEEDKARAKDSIAIGSSDSHSLPSVSPEIAPRTAEREDSIVPDARVAEEDEARAKDSISIGGSDSHSLPSVSPEIIPGSPEKEDDDRFNTDNVIDAEARIIEDEEKPQLKEDSVKEESETTVPVSDENNLTSEERERLRRLEIFNKYYQLLIKELNLDKDEVNQSIFTDAEIERYYRRDFSPEGITPKETVVQRRWRTALKEKQEAKAEDIQNAQQNEEEKVNNLNVANEEQNKEEKEETELSNIYAVKSALYKTMQNQIISYETSLQRSISSGELTNVKLDFSTNCIKEISELNDVLDIKIQSTYLNSIAESVEDNSKINQLENTAREKIENLKLRKNNYAEILDFGDEFINNFFNENESLIENGKIPSEIAKSALSEFKAETRKNIENIVKKEEAQYKAKRTKGITSQVNSAIKKCLKETANDYKALKNADIKSLTQISIKDVSDVFSNIEELKRPTMQTKIKLDWLEMREKIKENLVESDIVKVTDEQIMEKYKDKIKQKFNNTINEKLKDLEQQL